MIHQLLFKNSTREICKTMVKTCVKRTFISIDPRFSLFVRRHIHAPRSGADDYEALVLARRLLGSDTLHIFYLVSQVPLGNNDFLPPRPALLTPFTLSSPRYYRVQFTYFNLEQYPVLPNRQGCRVKKRPI